MRRLIVIAVIISAFFILPGISLAKVGAPLADAVTLNSPSACPSSGCAAGQRLNFSTSYTVSSNYSSGPNVQVCLYAPAVGQSAPGTDPWIDPATFSVNLTGTGSQIPYTLGETAGHICSTNLPSGGAYTFIGGAFANITPQNDGLNFVFRINHTANINGIVISKIYESVDGLSWSPHPQASLPVPTSPSSLIAFVANDANSCAVNAPCYVNSGDDLAEGIGTGLKDAIDAQTGPATINIINHYFVKSNAVNINHPLTVQGDNGAMVTFAGTVCTNPMLKVTDGATVQDLTINGGSCTSPARDLLSINSSITVSIMNNTFTNGNNAITIANSSADTLVRFNQITANSGYAIIRVSGTGVGRVRAVANNIISNRTGVQVECNNHGRVDHNFWGTGVLPSASVDQCTVTEGKRLGAAILFNPASSGVDAQRITVTTVKTSYFNQMIAFQHAPGDSDYDVYVVNHGYGSSENVPFYGTGTSMLITCNNYWDVFLAEDNPSTPNGLNAFLKYDLNQACVSTVESIDYCGQLSNPAKYPLYWYDPAGNATNGWNTTGQSPNGPGAGGASGQVTTCLIPSKEIKVALDSSGRPDFTHDLNFVPITVGLPAGINLVNFTANASISQVLLHWTTSAEVNVTGYYIVRSEQENGVYSRTSSFIQAKGNSNIGGIYNYLDTDLSFGLTYYYKLEVIGSNSQTIAFYGPIVAMTGTATPTITPTKTITLTPTITTTPTITMTPTVSKTPTVTITRTKTATYTVNPIYYTSTKSKTPFPTSTPKPSSTFTPVKTATASITLRPGEVTATSFSFTPGPDEGYPIVDTVSPTTSLSNTEPAYPGFNATPTLDDSGSGGYPYPADTTLTPGSTPTNSSISPTPSSPGNSGRPTLWVTLIAGGLIGIVAITISGWFIFKRRII